MIGRCWVVFRLGWAMVLAATFAIDHFELFGPSQVITAWRGTRPAGNGSRATMFYRPGTPPADARVPGRLLGGPTMTAGHLLFTVATTGYVLIAIRLEERDLVASLGDGYRVYWRSVPDAGARSTARSSARWPATACRPVRTTMGTTLREVASG